MASDAPRRKLSLHIHRGRKDADRNDSSSSLGSAPPMDDHASGLKPSIDNVFAKVKERRARKSQDLRRGSDESSKGLRGLLPSSKKSRRKSSQQDSDVLSASSDLLSADTDLRADRQRGSSPNPSELSLGDQGSGHSSLLTEDSDDQAPIRPTLSPHQSHAGYLTLSSPLINTSATNSPLPEDIPNLAESLVSPASPEKADSSLSLPPVSTTTSDRRQSPADIFKGAFTLPKKKPVAEITSEAHEAFPDLDPDFNDITVSSPRPSTPKSLPQKPTISITTTTVPSTPPNTVDPPTTFVTPPTPTEPQSHFSNASAPSLTSAVNNPPSYVKAAAERRKRVGTFTSSKLSASPLTTHIEEAKTPGGTITAPNTTSASGFFSSVFNAAQNAASQLSTTLNTSIASNQKNKPQQLDQTDAAGGEEVIPGPETTSSPETEPGAKRQLAVETLGRGDLSLDQLGISTESSDVSPMNSNVDLQDASHNFSQSNSNGQKQEESAAQRAVSAAYEKPVEKAVSQATGGRPLSMISGDGSDAGFQTPPRTSGTFDSVKRTGSVRSRLSGRRRHRGSSAATGGTLAAAVSASSATIVPGALGQGHRSTGFAVASSKRNKDFHQLFRSVPEDDYLIEDYSSALQRDILLHGRLYVSEGHICFSSNILGWVTNLVISFDEVVSVEKKSTAVIFPNALVIQTLHARNVFASLVARDSTYDLIISIWKISHPNLKSSLHGVALEDSTTGDKTERAESVASDQDSSDQATEDDVYDEDEDQDDMGSFYEPGGSIAGSEVGDQAVSRKTSGAPVTAGVSTSNGPTKAADVTEAAAPGATASADFPGPATHAPTDCGDEGSHYDRSLADTTIPAPLGKVYSLMWGPASGNFMKKWLVDDQKSRELSFENEKGGMDDTHRTFTYSYIKPLNAPVGPRQTKCIVTATIETFDLEKCVSVNCSTATPDVPSGGVFTTKTRYCMMWGPNNSTRLIANCTVEWTGKSWLKGPIEKGANDGQTQYVKDLVAALTAGVAAKATSRGAPRGKGKGRRRTDAGVPAEHERITVASKKVPEEANWGLFEPIRGLLEPFVDILQPLFSAQIIIPILVLLLAWTWLFPSRPRSTGVGFAVDSPGRLAAYEELWRREESELWDWLEDRVGLSNGIPVGGASQEQNDRQKVLSVKQMSRRLRNHNLEGKQVEDAIRVTEERLSTLKDAVKRNKAAEKEEEKKK